MRALPIKFILTGKMAIIKTAVLSCALWFNVCGLFCGLFKNRCLYG